MSLLRLFAVSILGVVMVGGCGGMAMAKRAGAAMPTLSTAAGPALDPNATTTQIPEQLVIEGSLSVQVTEIGDVVPALRALVEGGNGRVIEEVVSGGETSWSAHVKVRVPPDQVAVVVAWLAKRGDILDKRITATDVSRTLFDQDLEIANRRAALDRLTELLGGGGLAMNDVLAIEKEMTRLRGEIEAIEGEHRFLKDRVALATLDVSLSRRDGAVTVAQAKAYPGVRAAALYLLDPAGRQQTRLGVGFVVHTILRNQSMEVDVFEAAPPAGGGGASRAVVATSGAAAYSDFLGRGQRQFGNPYLGFRLGYGYLDASKFVVQGEAGVELFKAAHALIDVNVRATGLIGRKSDAALVFGAGAVFAF